MRLRPAALLVVLFTAACDGGLAPQPICARNLVGLCGTARFSGTLPVSTDAVFIVAFPTFPQTCDDLLVLPPKFVPFPPFNLPLPYRDSVAYDLPLAPGTYAWVVAVWKKQGMVTSTKADTAIFRVAGDYRDPSDNTQRGSVTVGGASAVDGVDVAVDFDNLHPVTGYVSCATR